MYIRLKRRQMRRRTFEKLLAGDLSPIQQRMRQQRPNNEPLETHWAVDVVVVESKRVDGKPRQRQLAHLGTIDERLAGWAGERLMFWRRAERALEAFSAEHGEDAALTIRQDLETLIPPALDTDFIDPEEWFYLKAEAFWWKGPPASEALFAIADQLTPADCAGRHALCSGRSMSTIHGQVSREHQQEFERILREHPEDAGILNLAVATMADSPKHYERWTSYQITPVWLSLVGLSHLTWHIDAYGRSGWSFSDRRLESILTPAARADTYRVPA